jgi:hypothetical protein
MEIASLYGYSVSIIKRKKSTVFRHHGKQISSASDVGALLGYRGWVSGKTADHTVS